MLVNPQFSRVLLSALLVLLAARAAGSEPLPSDPRIKTGKLGNGVTWMYLQHENPPGKIWLMTHVRTGSLNETDAQRGLAHFMEHMAFNGTEHFAPGELIPYFESIGMEFGADLNAFTSFDQTVYMLFLPDTKVETVDDGLKVLSDYAFRMLLLEEELDKERGVILSELRAGMSARQRIRDKLFERLFEGMRVAQRIPIGIEDVIKGAPRSEFERYYRTWYRPENVTLMLVGDAPPERYTAAIEKWFGTYRTAVPAEAPKGAGLKPFTTPRAIVLSDPEYSQADVDVFGILPGRPPTTTVEQARVDLIEEVGNWMIGRRFSERIKKGEASYTNASASVFDFFGEGMLVNAGAEGEPQDWEKVLEQLITEVNRARVHGFLPQEFELVKSEILAGAERAVRTEATRDAREVIERIRGSVNEKRTIMSAEQELDLVRKQLPGITLQEVNAAFAANFKPGTFAYVLTMPTSATLPGEDAVLAAAKAAQARETEPPVWEERPTSILEAEPTPGKMAESTFDEDLAITSAWLENGVRVHHRYMDYEKDTVLVSLTLAGGEIEETAENAGVTTVASLALRQPATHRLRSTDVEDLMTGKNIRVGGAGENDAFTITVSGSPIDLEIGLQLVHALLIDGVIEQTAFDTWKQQALQRWELLSAMPQFRAVEALLDLMSGGDPRQTLMGPERIEAQSVEQAQAWFDRLRREAPIEVAVVGELKLENAMPLIEKYVGSLPKRARGAARLDALRKVKRGPGPFERHVSVQTMTPQAMVISGFLGCDGQNVPDLRALNLASLTLQSRLIKRVREELGLVYSIGAQSRPSWTYRDCGLFFSGAPCAPDKAGEVVNEVDAIFAAFAADGPTEEELANAKKQTANDLDSQLKEPTYWFTQLQALELHGIKLADLKNIPQAYDALTADQVKQAFAKYYTPARRIRVTAAPVPAPATATAPAEPK